MTLRTRERLLEKQLQRSRAQVAALEQLTEEKLRMLFLAQEDLQRTTGFLENVLATIRSAVIVVGRDGTITSVNRAAVELSGHPREALVGSPIAGILPHLANARGACLDAEHEVSLVTASGQAVPVLFSASPMRGAGDQGSVCVAHDIRDLRRLEVELRQAQKLESVGQLAAGVAHEINTPIQFTGDSVEFLTESCDQVLGVLVTFEDLRRAAGGVPELAAVVAAVDRAAAEADLEFLAGEIPAAARRAAEGVSRVAKIVRAMKAFAYVGGTEKTPNDLNEAVRTTLEVSRSEFKYVARERLDLGELPPVLCNLGDINQVVLNLIVNAAHAMQDKVGESGELGELRIATRQEGDWAVVEIGDSGTGIPAAVQARIFEPFFTTKEVGRGTGQGLALARNVVVDKHGGTLTFETEEGCGTTFRIRLPIAGGGR